MLRVAHVSPAYFAEESLIGGGERYVSYVVRSLSEAAEALPFELKQSVFALGPREHTFFDGGVEVHVLKNESCAPHPMSAASPRLWELLLDYDLIHVHQALTLFGCYCAVVARTLGKTMIMTDLGGGENEILLKYGGINLADGLLSISGFAKSLIAGYFKGPHVSIIGPVDTDTFSPGAAHVRTRDALVVGRLLPHKGIDRILEALPPTLHLFVVGRRYHDDYFELLNRKAAGKQVTFITDADDTALKNFYRTCGVYIHASTYTDVYGHRVDKPELMGLTTLEALSSGMPVVVANTASLPELAPDFRFSRVFKSVDHLSQILTEYVDGSWPPESVAELARNHTVQNYSFRVVGERIARFYADVHQRRTGVTP